MNIPSLLKNSLIKNYLVNVSLLVLSAFVLSGCEGDARDLTEPVEAGRLNLSTLSIVPPSGSRLPLTVNPDEVIAFTLAGRNNTGQAVDVASTNRRWSVSDASVGTINDDGFFTAVQDGEVDIYVLVGGAQAPPFTVEVSFGVLSDIAAIEGSATLQPCIAQTYTTAGLFSDGSTRALDSISWSIEPPESGSLEDGEEDGSIDLAGTTSGAITLTATSDGISGGTPLTIDSSLENIVLRDGLSLPANGTLNMDARGSYTGAAEDDFTDITQSVTWSTPQGVTQATISNTAGARGVVSGVAEGTTLVQAACGADIIATTTVTITPAVTRLVSEDGPNVDLNVNEIVQLRISTGTVYDEDNDITESADWNVVGVDASDIATVNDASGSKGEVTGVSRGEVTVRATYNTVQFNFTIDVN